LSQAERNRFNVLAEVIRDLKRKQLLHTDSTIVIPIWEYSLTSSPDTVAPPTVAVYNDPANLSADAGTPDYSFLQSQKHEIAQLSIEIQSDLATEDGYFLPLSEVESTISGL